MPKYLAIIRTFFARLGLRFKDNLVSDITREDAFCEFDCQRTQCHFNNWLHCANRLSYLALEERLAAHISNEIDVSSVTHCCGLAADVTVPEK
jgi:hypothetical protein